MTTLHEFGSVLGRPLDTFFWDLSFFTALGSCAKWDSWIDAQVATNKIQNGRYSEPTKAIYSLVKKKGGWVV
jgi:hypothetical protein